MPFVLCDLRGYHDCSALRSTWRATPFARFATSVGLRPPCVTHPATLSHPDWPATWGTRGEAEARAARIVGKAGGGIGIELGNLGDGWHLCGLDLDSCIGDDGELAPWAAAFLPALSTYGETSPSGTGIKAFFLCVDRECAPIAQSSPHLLTSLGGPPQRAGSGRPRSWAGSRVLFRPPLFHLSAV